MDGRCALRRSRHRSPFTTLSITRKRWLRRTYVINALFPFTKLTTAAIYPVLNRLIADGFAYYGYIDISETIRKSTLRLLSTAGHRECVRVSYRSKWSIIWIEFLTLLDRSFDSRTGTGLGGDAFSYSAAVWLSWTTDKTQLTECRTKTTTPTT